MTRNLSTSLQPRVPGGLTEEESLRRQSTAEAAVGRGNPFWSTCPSFPTPWPPPPEASDSLYAAFADGAVHYKPAGRNGWRQIGHLPGGVEALAVVS